MHIREIDEHLDWDTFMNEGLPDDAGHGEYTKALGQRVWGLLHGLADNYGCDACKDAFQTLVSGMHDVVNVKLGKPVYDEKRWQKFLALVDDAHKHNPHVKHFIEHRLRKASEFDPHSFRIVHQGKNEVRIGCPVGHFLDGRCTVGTEAQAVLHPK